MRRPAPRRGPLLVALLFGAAAAAFAQAPNVRDLAAKAFLSGDSLSEKFPPEARSGLSENDLAALGAADQVQAGSAGLDDAAFSAKVLGAADGLGIQDPAQRKAAVLRYSARRGGTKGVQGTASAADERAAVERAREANKRAVKIGANSFGPAGEAGGTGSGGPTGSPLRRGTMGTANEGVSGSGAIPDATGGRASAVAARIASLQGQAGVQRPAGFSLRPAPVPDVGAAAAGPAVKEDAASAAAAPAKKAPAAALDPDKFPAYGRRNAEKPLSGDDLARIEKTFNATIARLVREGKRSSGTGSFSGVVNNVQAMYGDKKERCYDQAEELLADLAKEFHANGGPRFVDPSGRWLFKMTTYTGEGHEADGHYWVTAISREPGDPTLVLDPWLGKITRSEDKNPIAIKPFLPYTMGLFMSKIMN
jgi:hypothetical protein